MALHVIEMASLCAYKHYLGSTESFQRIWRLKMWYSFISTRHFTAHLLTKEPFSNCSFIWIWYVRVYFFFLFFLMKNREKKKKQNKKKQNSDIVLSNAFNIDDLITRWRRKDRNSDFSFGWILALFFTGGKM